MSTVVCVLRSGGEFRPEHVVALYEGVRKHWPSDGPFLDFVCFTDTPIGRYGVREVPLVGGWPGWWSKVEVFRPDALQSTVLYLDLDTVVVGDLSPFLDYGGELAMLSDFYRPQLAQSGVMAFRAGSGTEAARLWAAFVTDSASHIARFRGDGEWLHDRARPDRLQDLYPGQIVSYKVHCGAGVPDGARIVCHHGKPRPWEVAA